MADPTSSNPARFGYGQSGSDERALFLDVFGGEVYAAFDLATLFADKVEMKSIGKGFRSARFPKTWKATSEYHTPGQELMGNDIDTTEITITVDDILVSHVEIADIDEMLTHFDVRSKFSDAMGRELAKAHDKNIARQLILAARTAADGPFPGGTVITDASLVNSGAIDGKDWIDAIRDANLKLYNKDVPESLPRYMAVNADVFDAIKYAKDTNGQHLILNQQIAGTPNSGGVAGRVESMVIDGVTVFRTRNMPTANETSDTSVYKKYRANYSTTTAVMWAPMAVGCVKLMDIGFETTRDTRRLTDFTVAKMLVGNGTLRPECALEFKTS